MTRGHSDKRTLPEIAARQISDWDHYAATLRRDIARLSKTTAVSGLSSLSASFDHIALLLDEVDNLRHDIRRAYDIANEYLNDTMRLRKELASAIEARSGETVELGSTEGESAVPNGETPP